MTSDFFEYIPLRQRFETTELEDVSAAVRAQMRSLLENQHHGKFQRGQSVALAVGSRGIDRLDEITRAVIEVLFEFGLRPFIVPAMGSHGGATAEGQAEVLARYNITEETMGCPIRSSMQTSVLGSLNVEKRPGETEIIPIHFDQIASEADHVFLINRVKTHTRFSGKIESGLLKMMMIGLGKAIGASLYHRAVYVERFDTVLREVSRIVRKRVSFLGGLAIVENARDRTAHVEALTEDMFEPREEELLVLAKKMMPSLPFEEIDLLFIDRIGKNISGTGFDSNIVGRKFDDHKAVRDEKPQVHCIAVRALTAETHGNANGIGMAEFCLSSLLKEMDVAQTRINAITANHVSAAMLPLDYETEREILQAASESLGRVPIRDMKIVRIADTLHLETLLCSESLRKEIDPLLAANRAEILDTAPGVDFFTFPLPGQFLTAKTLV